MCVYFFWTCVHTFVCNFVYELIFTMICVCVIFIDMCVPFFFEKTCVCHFCFKGHGCHGDLYSMHAYLASFTLNIFLFKYLNLFFMSFYYIHS